MQDETEYEAETNGIVVRVSSEFLDEESSPENDRYMWAYHVEIENRGERTLKLEARHWRITDCKGRHQIVNGEGVVGMTPTLEPGESFEYSSGAPLAAPSGLMLGSYRLSDENGDMHDVAIPMFNLNSPYDTSAPN